MQRWGIRERQLLSPNTGTGITGKLLSIQKLHLAPGSTDNINNRSGLCKRSNSTAVSTPELSKEPKESVRKCSSNVRFQKHVSLALVWRRPRSQCCCVWRGWQKVPVPQRVAGRVTTVAFTWGFGPRCGGSWNRRAAEMLSWGQRNNNSMPLSTSILLLPIVPTKWYF